MLCALLYPVCLQELLLTEARASKGRSVSVFAYLHTRADTQHDEKVEHAYARQIYTEEASLAVPELASGPLPSEPAAVAAAVCSSGLSGERSAAEGAAALGTASREPQAGGSKAAGGAAGATGSAGLQYQASAEEQKRRKFKRKRAPTPAEAAALELQRQTNAALPKDDPFTDAVVSGFRVRTSVYEKLRTRFVSDFIKKAKEKRLKYRRTAPHDPEDDDATTRDLDLKAARKAFVKTPDSERLSVLRSLLSELNPNEHMLAAEFRQAIAVLDYRAEERRASLSLGGQIFMAKVWLVTYHDDSFVIESLAAEPSARVNEAKLVAAVKLDPSAQSLFKDFQAFVAQLEERFPHLETAGTAEICMDTYRKQGVVRLHLHLGMARQPRLAIEIQNLAFRGVIPFSNPKQGVKVRPTKLKKDGYEGARNQVFYYVSVEKLGTAFGFCKLQAHKDFPVNPGWVAALLEASGLSFSCFFFGCLSRFCC